MSAATVIPWTPEDSEPVFSALFGNAPIGWVKCEPPGYITAVNAGLNQILESESGIVPPLKFSSVIDSTERVLSERLLQELFEGERDSFELQSKTRSGRPVCWRAWQVSPKNGGERYVLATAENLAAVTMESRLHTDRLEAVGRLASGVAHDFNNLLTGVLLSCDLLLAHLESGHRGRRYAEEIRKAGMQTVGLVQQLLTIARPQNSSSCALSLNEIATGMRTLLARLIRENIALKFDLGDVLGMVRLNPTEAQQILLNLVLNSRDAMPDGGEIAIETRNCKVDVLSDFVLPHSALTPAGSSANRKTSLPCVLLAVHDNGAGMDAHTRAHLFDPFFSTKGDRGTGLGLATVHGIVVSNGGLIYVESEPGRGTRVNVLLPQALPDSPDIARQNKETQNEETQNHGFSPERRGDVRSSQTCSSQTCSNQNEE
jgi:signal transduction histidine kinase